MKRFKKIVKWTGIIILLIISGLLVTVFSRQNRIFSAPFPSIKASTDSAVIARGKYLVYGPAHCADCHTNKQEAEKIKAGELLPLAGGNLFSLPIGTIYTPNLTPDKETGLGNVSDQQIARALRYGVAPDGRAMLDFMPFHNTSDEDLAAIISYLRTMPAVKREIPKRSFNLLGKGINAFLIEPVYPDEKPLQSIQPDSTVEYGRYLARSVANCRGCHTNRNLMTGAFIGEDFSGGFKFEDDPATNGIFTTPNLTPDLQTGHITNWTQEQFIDRFRKGRIYQASPMPWGPFSHMTDNDLKAIYKYLHSLKPVSNKVEVIYQPPVTK